MIVTTSSKFKILLDLADGQSTMPASTLKTIAVSLKSLIPEIEELERRLEEACPQDATPAAPSVMDELREQGRLLREQLDSDVKAVRGGLARKLRDAAQALNPED